MKMNRTMHLILIGFMLFMGLGYQALAETQKGGKEMTVAAGKEVSIEYTLTLEDKTVVDTNVGGQPFTFVQGNQQIIPGLEKQIEGLKVGDNKKITVQPDEGYGAVNQEAFLEVDKGQLPPEALHAGAQIQGQTPEGQPMRGMVKEVKEGTVVLDFNHPLAGQTLYFDVKVLEVASGGGGTCGCRGRVTRTPRSQEGR